MAKYNYVRIIHEGQDYITVVYGRMQFDITEAAAIKIIKVLLTKLNS